LLLTIHSAALRVTLASLIGDEWTYLLEGGLAGQRILGEVFQPSSFGIFLIISIYLFLIDYRILALIALALAASVHPTYLLSAGSLVLSFMVLVYQEERSVNKALQIGVIAFILVLPILIYVATSFRSSEQIWHHRRKESWCDFESSITLKYRNVEHNRVHPNNDYAYRNLARSPFQVIHDIEHPICAGCSLDYHPDHNQKRCYSVALPMANIEYSHANSDKHHPGFLCVIYIRKIPNDLGKISDTYHCIQLGSLHISNGNWNGSL
jgi:hypothetical protein